MNAGRRVVFTWLSRPSSSPFSTDFRAPFFRRAFDRRAEVAIFMKVMATYRELLAARAPRSTRSRRRRRTPCSKAASGRCSSTCDCARSGTRASARRPPPAAQQPRVTGRGPDPRQDASARRLLRERRPLGVRDAGAPRARLRARRQPRGGFADWKRNGYELTTPTSLSRRSGPATHATCSSPRSARRASSGCSSRASC